MGFRFRKSISIIPGVRMNVSGSGVSMSVGPRGASVSFGKRGTYANLGLPGTGLSYRTRLDRASASCRQRAATNQDNPHLRAELEREVQSLNDAVDEIINIHVLTPDPRSGHSYDELERHYRELALKPYSVPAPVRPEKPVPAPEPERPAADDGRGVIGRLFESAEARIERQRQNELRWTEAVEACRHGNELMLKRYQVSRQKWAEQYANWQHDAEEHDQLLQHSAGNITQRFASDSVYFESLLEEVLQAADWPRETIISFQVIPAESVVLIDVDLPEIEDLPANTVRLNAKGTEIIEKEISQKALRERYAKHIHGIMLRLTGMALCALPFNTVKISGFTQRISRQTGHLEDEYIISARIARNVFEQINFSRLEDIDPVEAFDRFDLQRKMSSTFLFQPVSPLI